jgi:transcriptional regulator with XRE-family HTH domain
MTDTAKYRVRTKSGKILDLRSVNQAALARATGYKPCTVSLIFRKLRNPSLAGALKIADALDITVEQLMQAPALPKVEDWRDHRRDRERSPN